MFALEVWLKSIYGHPLLEFVATQLPPDVQTLQTFHLNFHTHI